MSSLDLQLRTLFVLNEAGRMVQTREPGALRPHAQFFLIRAQDERVWAARDDVPVDVAQRLGELVAAEPTADFTAEPTNAKEYVDLLGGSLGFWGAAFEYPQSIEKPDGVQVIDDPELLTGEFENLGPEIEGRSPVFGIVEDGMAVSVCFCARRSDEAAEAGLNTMKSLQGRGYGPRVAAAWGNAIRASGRVPLYSALWTNTASLSVARKLGLQLYASNWSVNA